MEHSVAVTDGSASAAGQLSFDPVATGVTGRPETLHFVVLPYGTE